MADNIEERPAASLPGWVDLLVVPGGAGWVASRFFAPLATAHGAPNVWRVYDTARATFDVEDYRDYVTRAE